uniref:NADH-ubiquinone oxidoreductase chain 1 n=1 Tax=Tigriopus californicus TaxID=6832 RepID=A2T4Y1_TIGCA|nr:NADH dehydrogenase subunit 1 [Tigriopus californicus]ABI33093.1 NADH dehydrogenase subunit 1 [Tigriopus californicus]
MMFDLVVSSYVVVLMLVNVAFVTLMERKILGCAQFRKGPNKVSLGGVLQPIADAIKLFGKEIMSPSMSNSLLFSVAPALGLVVFMLITSSLIGQSHGGFIEYSLIYILCIMSLGVYPLFVAGWSSNNKYALLGSLRGIAQSISYEISLSLIFLSLMLLSQTFSVSGFEHFLPSGCLTLFLSPLMLLWLVSCLAETNRTPFDFSEGESELVSGFNVEFGGLNFVFMFMSEYGMILFFSVWTSNMFIAGSSLSFSGSVGSLVFVFFWMWTRATLPRFRYDKLMMLAWTSILPVSLGYVCFTGVLGGCV